MELRPLETSSSVSARKRRWWALPVVMLLVASGAAGAIYNARHTKIEPPGLPHENFHVPFKCRQQAFDITSGQVQANLPMMEAKELEDLTVKCGGWIERK